MEGLIELVPLLIVAGYYLLRARRRAEQRQRANPPPEARTISEPKGPTPFQQFLQQIEEAVAEASGEPVGETAKPPEPPPQIPSPLPAPPAKPVRPAPEFRAIGGSFDAPTPVDHVEHGFGLDNPLSEERFERRRPQSPAPRQRGPLPDPHGLKTRPTQDTPIPGLSHWRSKLRDPKAAREAFVLQTIFGSRGGRRADKRPD